MATATVLATNVGAAIGAKFPTTGNRLVYASFYGSLSQVDLSTQVLSTLGGGFANPEDIAIARPGSGPEVWYLTERAGTLLRIDQANPDRAHATVVAGGMVAPHQIALTADGGTAYLVEYTGSANGRLWRVDLASGAMTALRNDLDGAVGALYDDSRGVLYITEQGGGGSISRIDVNAAGSPRALTLTGFTAPFFLTWCDATRAAVYLPLRDPANRIVRIDLAGWTATTPPTVTTVLDGVPFRPSSVAVLPGGDLIVCSDQQITQYAMSTPRLVSPRGLGGGGSLYCPAISPADPREVWLSCDMFGLYRSTDSGQSWTLQDTRQVFGSTTMSVAFDPAHPGELIGGHPQRGLMLGRSTASTVTWTPFTPQPPGFNFFALTAAAFAADGQRLVLGLAPGLRRLDRSTGSWSTITSAAVPGGTTTSIGQVLGVGWGRAPSQAWCFAADANAVYWSTDSGSSWTVLRPSGGGGALPANVRGLAVGTGSDGTTVVYATVADSGVWRCALPVGSSPASAPAWQNVSTGLPGAPSQFDQLATCAADPATVYAGRSQGWDTAPGWTVYAGHFDGTTMTWRGAFDGFTNESANHNVQPGWIDVAEAPAALGFGFGGAPRGLACSPTNPAVVMQVNNAFADLSTTGAPNTTSSPYGWQQIYTRPDGPGWQTTGLDVTNVWRYVIHPTKPQLHYLANTDIGLSRSLDSGITWQFVRARRGSVNWGNFYDLAFGPAGQCWAAVSTEHDLPYDSQLTWEKTHRTDPAHQETDPANPSIVYQTGAGAVLVSSDDGQSWSELGTGLPDRPVLSVVFGNGTLYAAVWRRGVFQLPGGDPAGTWTAVGDIGGQRRVRRLAFDASGRLHCIACGTNGEAGLYLWTGTSWQCLTTALTAGCMPNFVPFDFSFDPSDPHAYWVCTSGVQGGPDGALWRSTDDGAHWSKAFDINRTGTAYRDFLHVTDVTFDPADLSYATWYVTTETHGTWYTTDRGANWREFGVVPFTAAQRITFDPADHTVLYQATKGAGAWSAMTAAASMSLAQQIRRTAYRTYQARQGRPGDPTADWLTAQQQVLGPAIKTRAWQLYLRRGGQPGHALDDWLRAEQEIVRALRGF